MKNEPFDLVILHEMVAFTEEILNRKYHFLSSGKAILIPDRSIARSPDYNMTWLDY